MNTNSKEYTDQPESEHVSSCDISQYTPKTNTQKMDMKVKVYFEDPSREWEIRRTSVPDEAVNYKDIADRIATLFPSADVAKYNLCWKDEEGDFIAFSSQEEFEDAVKTVEDGVFRVYLREIEEVENNANVDQHEEVGHRPWGRHGRRWRRHFNKNRNEFGKANGGPYWAPGMRRCMRRCMMQAWYMKHADQDGSETMEKKHKKWHHFDMKPQEIPEEWRKWMRDNIQQGVNEACEDSLKVSEDTETDTENAEAVREETDQKTPFDHIPRYWRRHIRHCTRKAWEKNFEDTSTGENGDERETKNPRDLPLPLRKFMHHKMMKAWNAAAGKDTDNAEEECEGACGWKKTGPYGRAGRGRGGRRGRHGRRGYMGHFHRNVDGDIVTEGISKGMKQMDLNEGGDQAKEHEESTGGPYWAPHMRRCMRRCMMQAWHMNYDDISEEDKDKGHKKRRHQMKQDNIPKRWRKWVRGEIQQNMKKAWEEEKVAGTTGEVEEDEAEDGASKKPFDSVPMYWRRHMRRSTRRAWKKAHEEEDSAEDGTTEKLPPPLRHFMRRNLVKAWEAAANENKENPDEQNEVDSDNACGNNQANKVGPLHEVPWQWKGAMRVTMGKACRALDHFKHVAEGEDVDMEVMSDLNSRGAGAGNPLRNMKPGIRQFMREAMLDGWNEFKAEEDVHNEQEKGEQQSSHIPKQWRQAMRRSMIKLWKESCSNASGENDEDVPKSWEQFMENNMDATWKAFAEANTKDKRFGPVGPPEMKPWNAKYGRHTGHFIRMRRRLMNAHARRETLNLRIFNLRQKKGKVMHCHHKQDDNSGDQEVRLMRINHRLKHMNGRKGAMHLNIQNLQEKLGQQGGWRMPWNGGRNCKMGKFQAHGRGFGKHARFCGPDYMAGFQGFGGRPECGEPYYWHY